MKFLAVFSAVLAVACASNTWTLQMLSDAASSPNTDPALVPYLEAALNNMMAAIWAGETVESVTVSIPSVDVSGLSLNELSDAIQNPNTDPALLPALETALNELMESMWTGNPVAPVTVAVPAMELHYYTLNELSEALQDPSTNPALIPYLEHALNGMMSALFDGQQMTFTIISVPVGLTPVVAADSEAVPIMPITPEVPSVPVESPVAPASPSSPLVQIIVNINQQQEAAVPAATEEIAASPVQVVDNAPVNPIEVVDVAPVSPVQVDDVAPVSPVQVVDVAPVSPVQVVDVAPVSPVEVVEVAPVNPVEVVDVAPVSPVQVVDPIQAVPITPVQAAQPIAVDPVQVIETAPVAVEPIVVAQPIFSH